MDTELIKNFAVIVAAGTSICSLTPTLISMMKKKKKIKFCKSNQNLLIVKKEFESTYGKKKDHATVDRSLIQMIRDFEAIFKEKFPYISLDNFYKNVSATTIEKKPDTNSMNHLLFKIKRRNDPAGYVNVYDEKLVSFASKNVLFHELLHLSSTYKSDNISMIGFYQIGSINGTKINIGRGLNEGYTEFLTDAMLSKSGQKQTSDTYQLLEYAAFKFREIIGFEEMTKAYFNADLYSIKEIMKNFIDEAEFISFIKYLDNIQYALMDSNGDVDKVLEQIDMFFNKIRFKKRNK